MHRPRSVEGRGPGSVEGGHLGRRDLAEGRRVRHEADLHAAAGGAHCVGLALGVGKVPSRAGVVTASLPVPGVDVVHGSSISYSSVTLH